MPLPFSSFLIPKYFRASYGTTVTSKALASDPPALFESSNASPLHAAPDILRLRDRTPDTYLPPPPHAQHTTTVFLAAYVPSLATVSTAIPPCCSSTSRERSVDARPPRRQRCSSRHLGPPTPTVTARRSRFAASPAPSPACSPLPASPRRAPRPDFYSFSPPGTAIGAGAPIRPRTIAPPPYAAHDAAVPCRQPFLVTRRFARQRGASSSSPPCALRPESVPLLQPTSVLRPASATTDEPSTHGIHSPSLVLRSPAQASLPHRTLFSERAPIPLPIHLILAHTLTSTTLSAAPPLSRTTTTICLLRGTLMHARGTASNLPIVLEDALPHRIRLYAALGLHAP
ncbi:hypothetical protein B0H13DRAFT_2378827 [Mycena leptocephala]|nr:hypothetical protein B0H13DRAFT_2378827 [Mycena leptocephala]